MIQVSRKIREMESSPTLEISALAAELGAAGHSVVAFAAGQPDFATPDHVCEAAFQAVRDGYTGYMVSAGLPELRQVVAEVYSARLGVALEPSNVVVTVGAKNALGVFFQATLDPGDQVVVPAPYWVSYPTMVRAASAEPVIVDCPAGEGYLLSPDALASSVTARTRALILNSPSNPTGSVYSRQQMTSLVDRALELGVSVLSDEIYEDLLYDGAEHVSPLSLHPDRIGDLAVVTGVSKTYAMTGWRIGWLIGPPDLVKAMAKIVGQTTSGPATFAQKAAVAALTGDRSFLQGWTEQYAARRDVMLEGLSGIPGMTPHVPRGAFYLWVDVAPLLGRLLPDGTPVGSSRALARYLLEKEHVATVPGSAFGAEGHLRLSFATAMEDVEEGIGRLARAVERLSAP
jgi:aspartate aminotransferase